MSIPGLVVVLVVLITCFFAPGWVPYRPDRGWIGVKRILCGTAAVWIALAVTLILFHVLNVTVVLRSDFVFLFIGASLYWIPLLLIRVIQLGLRDRKPAQGSVA